MQDKQGHVIVIAGPSGAGKTTVVEAFLEQRKKLCRVITSTTRKPRKKTAEEIEVDGVDYHFYSEARFEDMLRAESFLETAKYAGNWYGTEHNELETIWEKGHTPIASVNLAGVRSYKRQYPNTCAIFILPRFVEDLEKRLVKRGTPRDVIQKRIEEAKLEIAVWHEYCDYAVVADDGDLEGLIRRSFLILDGYLKLMQIRPYSPA